MKIVDLNVPLYAVNQDSAHHAKLRKWWESALGADEPIALVWVVLLGFLRLATNPKVFPKPLTVEQAIVKVDRWLAHPNVRVIHETDEQWRVLQDLLRQA